jgi:cell division septation protein DedD
MLPTGRRSLPARHELRFGTRELVIFCGAFLLVWGLTFAFGILVGREIAGPAGDGAPGKPGAGVAAGRASVAEPAKKPERAGGTSGAPGADDRLTFYKTLTAPAVEVPPTEPPRIEEHIVPREAPPDARPAPPTRPAPRVARAAPRPAPPADVHAERSPAPARRTEPAAAPAAAVAPVAAAPAAAAAPGAGAASAGADALWTVQVSSFRSRSLAEELRTRLAARGFDAYLTSVSSEEGRVRHRVRVGAFATRGEAERVVAELKLERNVNPFVTTRQR